MGPPGWLIGLLDQAGRHSRSVFPAGTLQARAARHVNADLVVADAGRAVALLANGGEDR